MPKNVNLAILVTWLIAGTLDGLAAVLFNIHNPLRVFIFIASAIFGKVAYGGGIQIIVLGIVFHYLIAYIFTTFWFTLFPYIKKYLKNTYLIAAIYGLLTWVIMNLVIVPLSRLPKTAFHINGVAIGIIILMICIGLPIALMANKFYFGKKPGKL